MIFNKTVRISELKAGDEGVVSMKQKDFFEKYEPSIIIVNGKPRLIWVKKEK